MTIKPSNLLGALRRIGGQIQHLEDVEGIFTTTDRAGSKRIYGTLRTHDAQVRVGFDSGRVALPPEQPCRIVVSGKLWLHERSSVLTLMVRKYRVLEEAVE